MIDLTINRETLAANINKARAAGMIIPTFAQMKDPSLIPDNIRDKLSSVGLWDIDSVNLFRITWKNEPKEYGGLFGCPNYIEFPPELTGVPCRIVALVGKWFPTGCHKVGAAFGCLVPRLITGQFDAQHQKAVWPSTGNYCRGGAFNSKLLNVSSVAILPQGMSRERFDWLSSIAGEVIATPGSESNVKEIFDKANELCLDPSFMIFNQFEDMGNHLWHYEVTGNAMAEVFDLIKRPGDRFSGACFTVGSAGTIAAGDRLKQLYPELRLAAGEALQCPTLLQNGFGTHRIEGIGDKHVTWIHNVRNTDMVTAIDDNDSYELLRLFNEPEGRKFLQKELGIPAALTDQLGLLGISGIANLLCCIKMAKYYEFGKKDVIATVLTDSADMYASRIEQLWLTGGIYTSASAAADYAGHIRALRTDNMEELTYVSRKRIHNLKYYTWVEQQGKTAADLDALWYDSENTWDKLHALTPEIDRLIDAFNAAVTG